MNSSRCSRLALGLLFAPLLSPGDVLAAEKTTPARTSVGERIAFVSARDGNPEIYTVNTDGSFLVRLTFNAAEDEFPAWSPDGQSIAFHSKRTGAYQIYVMNADGSNVVQRTFSNSYNMHPSWSPDGATIAYSAVSAGSANLWKVGAWSGSPSLLFAAPGWDDYPDWSPQGTRLALSSDWYAYDFVQDLFLVNADGTGFKGLTGNIFDHVDYLVPSWAPDGTKLSLAIVQTVGIDQYVTNVGRINEDGTGLTPLASAATWTRSSWSPDGQRIAYTSPAKDVAWIRADGTASGTVTTNGWNADWQPPPSPIGVEPDGPRPSRGLRVLTNPARGVVRFAVERLEPGDALDIYDVSGRHVGHVPLGTELSQIVVWDGRRAGCGPGVYYARPRFGPAQGVRFVILR